MDEEIKTENMRLTMRKVSPRCITTHALKHKCSAQISKCLVKVLTSRVLIHCFDLVAFRSVEFTLERGTKQNYEVV